MNKGNGGGGLVLSAVLLMALSATGAHAAAAGSSFYIVNLLGQLTGVTTNVLIPFLAVLIVAIIGGGYGLGYFQLGDGLSRLLIGGAILAGGVAALVGIVGGNVAQAVLLPLP